MNFLQILLLALIITAENSFSQGKFEFNINCQYAYHASMAMRFHESDSLLAIEKRKNPGNLIPYFIEDFKRFFILGFNQDPIDFANYEIEKDNALQLLSQGSKDSPYFLYTQAEILIHWGLLDVSQENYFKAYTEIRKGFDLLQENQKLFPSFIANKKFIGFLHSIVGTIPENYKWFAVLLGLHGTVPQGIAEVQEVVDFSKTQPFLFADEARYVLLIQKMWLQNDINASVSITEEKDFPSINKNPLAAYAMAIINSKAKQNDKAIDLYEQMPLIKNAFIPCFSYFMLGKAKLERNDADAYKPLEFFAAEFKGKVYLKEVYRSIAWSHLINGNENNYRKFISLCKTRGNLFTDADKEAVAEAESGMVPDTILLKARLLNDGGYNQRAYAQLSEKSENDFTNAKDKLELIYRKGRILDDWNKSSLAKPYYKLVLEKGAQSQYYYAANASLKLAQLYEKENLMDSARYFYSTCLKMKDHEYKTSIDQKAKAGLSRLEK